MTLAALQRPSEGMNHVILLGCSLGCAVFSLIMLVIDVRNRGRVAPEPG